MNEQGTFIATLLDASRKAYAAGTVLRIQESGPAAAKFVTDWGFQALVDDSQIRLQHLAEALASGFPQLLALDVQWMSATYAARAVPAELLRTSLTCLRAELEESLPPDSAALACEYVTAAIDSLDAPSEPCPSLLIANEPHVELARAFLLAVLEGERAKAEALLLNSLAAGVSIPDLHHHVIHKAQAELGRMWQTGEVHVGEEHFGSRTVEDVLAQLRARMVKATSTGKCVLFASVSGNLHDIGLRIVADRFEMEGWRSIFLGANMPSADLAQAAQDFGADLIALSAGLAIHVRAAANTIDGLRQSLPDIPILIGGRPFALIPELWKSVGADACARSAGEALELGTRLVRDRSNG